MLNNKWKLNLQLVKLKFSHLFYMLKVVIDDSIFILFGIMFLNSCKILREKMKFNQWQW